MRRGAIAGAAVVAAVAWAAGRPRGDEAEWTAVERRDLVFEVDVEGELASIESAALGPPQIPETWNFKISFLAPEGSEVAAGQPVLGFDTTTLEQALLEKQALRDSTARQLEKRSIDLEVLRRDRELQLAEAEAGRRRQALKLEVPPELSSRHELAKARIDHALAEAEIANLETSLGHLARQTEAELAALGEKHRQASFAAGEIEAAIAAMTVAAPRAGTVAYRTSWNGEKRKVGDSVWRAEKVIEIPDLTRMHAVGQVDESELGRLAVGQPVTFELDAHRDLELRGRVRRLARAISVHSHNDPRKVAEVEIELEATDPERMRPGMRFRGHVETGRASSVLTVPLDAVAATAAGPTVTVAGMLGSRLATPRLGRRDAERVEVLAGLAEGERVRRRVLAAEPSP